jgi:hypothetical protein
MSGGALDESSRVDALVEQIVARLRAGPTWYYDLLTAFPDASYRDLLLAWGRVREQVGLARDADGAYLLADAAPNAARPPGAG